MDPNGSQWISSCSFRFLQDPSGSFKFSQNFWPLLDWKIFSHVNISNILDLATEPNEEFQECKTSQENQKSSLALQETPPASCSNNVVRVEYDGQLVQFRHKPSFPEWLNRWSVFSYSFESMTMTMTEEYYIYDTIGFISSVGGTLGLFVGFSFYDVIQKFLDSLFTIVQCKFKLQVDAD